MIDHSDEPASVGASHESRSNRQTGEEQFASEPVSENFRNAICGSSEEQNRSNSQRSLPPEALGDIAVSKHTTDVNCDPSRPLLRTFSTSNTVEESAQLMPATLARLTIETHQISAFQTPLGWLGLIGHAGKLRRIRIGQPSREAVIETTISEAATGGADVTDLDVSDLDISDWTPELRRRLIRYANGERVDFQDVELSWNRPLTSFRQTVLDATRRIPWGQTMTYAELAALAGSPGAARAVGTSMSTNSFPIVIPCHRVIGTGGQLRGFTAPRGVDLKSQMLRMEASWPEADETQHRHDASLKDRRN